MKSTFTHSTFFVTALTALFSLACQKPIAKTPGQEVIQNMPTSKPFTLTLSTGGGFSGLVEGYTLTSQGEVRAWKKRPGAPETTQWTKKDAPDSAMALAKSLQEFLSVDLQETGNMTTTIRYTVADSTWHWSISSMGASAPGSEPLQAWYARAIAYCLSLEPPAP